MDRIEKEFETLLQEVKIASKSGLSDHEKIMLLLSSNPSKIWWVAYELIGLHKVGIENFFIGYEASARFSELAKQTPDRIESRRCGKYMARRLIK